MANRLAQESSPYLLQHKDNPVDWFPWGPEAFARAKAEDKPIFLSIGYSSCHWCHVMAHESFEDEEVGAVLNEHFVCIKLDREERPDIDEAFMTFVHLTTGHGGWPMSVFLTPELNPFFGGTYWPKDDRDDHIGFLSMVRQIGLAWRQKADEIRRSSLNYAEALIQARSTHPPLGEAKLDQALLEKTVASLLDDFDQNNGGFGEAPKFPPHTSLELLLSYSLTAEATEELREPAMVVSLVTLQKMALGGIHDHVGGGFHRYSTDAIWLVPHFEKMLYDNALLLGNYARAAGIAHEVAPPLEALFSRVAGGIVTWVQREMTAPDGTFYSALDADSEGVEGKFYVWSRSEVLDLPNGEAFAGVYGMTDAGNYHDEVTQEPTGLNIPFLALDDGGAFGETLDALQERRSHRVRPGLDDKAIIAWNGLMIGSLAEAGVLGPAVKAASAILQAEMSHGELPHQITKGVVSGKAFLDDYAYFIDGLLKLVRLLAFLQDTGRQSGAQELPPSLQPEIWLEQARRLTEIMLQKFYDEKEGAFFGTAADQEALFGRSKPVFDAPLPSGNAIAIRCLSAFGEDERAIRSLEALAGWIDRAPGSTEALLLSAAGYLALKDEPKIVSTTAAVQLDSVPAAAPAAPSMPVPNVTVSLDRKEVQAGSDGWAQATLTLEVPDGLHLNSNEPPARWLTPTRLEIRPVASRIHYPVATEKGFEGTVVIPFEVQVPAGESGAEYEIKVTFQACTDSECLLPVEKTLNAVVVR